MAAKKPAAALLPILDKPVQTRNVELNAQILATLSALKVGQSFELLAGNTERARAQVKRLKKSGNKAIFSVRTNEDRTIQVGRVA